MGTLNNIVATHSVTLGKMIGGIIALGGIWHCMAPWTFGYADHRPAVISHLVSGGILFVFGAARALGWKRWPLIVCAVTGAWVLFAPLALRTSGMPFAMNDGLWGGFFVLLFCGAAAIIRMIESAPMSTKATYREGTPATGEH